VTETLRLIAPILSASTLAWVVYYLARNLRFRPKVARLLEDFYASAGNTPQANRSVEGSLNASPFPSTPGKSTSDGHSAVGILKDGGSAGWYLWL
jgi:hypothetical protein